METVLTNASPEQKLRSVWAASLAEHLAMQAISRKDLQLRLLDFGVQVTLQAIGTWLRGEAAPRAHHQAAVAAVLRVPARSLFPLEAAA